MTVEELIEALQKADPKQEVKFIDSEGNYNGDILTIETDGEVVYIVSEIY